jgi:hypothetical protein
MEEFLDFVSMENRGSYPEGEENFGDKSPHTRTSAASKDN